MAVISLDSQESSVEPGLDTQPDEVEQVLAALRALMARASSPVVRACLEEAHDAIAHLTGRDAAQDLDSAEVA
jgi:hypothetical protein